MTRSRLSPRPPLFAVSSFAILAILLAASAPHPGAIEADTDIQEVAYLRLVVEAAETTALGTSSAVRFRVRTVVGSLESSGVTLSQIEVGEIAMTSVLERPRVGSSRRPDPPRRVIGYRAWIPITVTTPAIQRVDYLVDRAAGAGAQLEWIEFGEVEEEAPEPVEEPASPPGAEE